MLLEVNNLSFHYVRGREIFHDVSFSLEKGEVLSIIGNNGAGKSTLLNCVAGLFRPSKGRIRLVDKEMSHMSMAEIARHIAYVPQIHQAVNAYTVREFVVMGRTPYIGTFARPGKKDYEIADEAIERMNIGKLADKLVTEISGGEKQQACIARALTQQPKLILLDEPTNHLDYGNQYRTINMIKGLSEEGYAVAMTTHNPDHAIVMGGKVAILDKNGDLKIRYANESLTGEVLSELYQLKIKTVYDEDAKRNVCVVI